MNSCGIYVLNVKVLLDEQLNILYRAHGGEINLNLLIYSVSECLNWTDVKRLE